MMLDFPSSNAPLQRTPRRCFATPMLIAAISAGLFTLAASSELSAQPPSNQRAAPPKFDPRDSAGIFFEDLFEEGLEGERPQTIGAAPTTGGAPSTGGPNNNGSGGDSSGGIYAWSQIISNTAIEDEIKAIKLAVDRDVTTPTKFTSRGYKLGRRHFSIAAMLFAVIAEFDGDVRWKKVAAHARDDFARSAANCKVGSQQAYNEAKVRKQDLQDLIGGGQIDTSGDASPEAEWDKVCDRAPLMQRIEMAHQGKLTPLLSNEGDFKANKSEILQEAYMVAVVAEVLKQEGMEDGDDDDYAGYSDKMKKAALDIVDGVKNDNYESARKAVGIIGQSCSECHELYRS